MWCVTTVKVVSALLVILSMSNADIRHSLPFSLIRRLPSILQSILPKVEAEFYHDVDIGVRHKPSPNFEKPKSTSRKPAKTRNTNSEKIIVKTAKFHPAWSASSSDTKLDTWATFYLQEAFQGKPHSVKLKGSQCVRVPRNFWFFDKPRSMLTSGCIEMFPKELCLGKPVTIAGGVADFRQSALGWGANSMRACKSHIQIHFQNKKAT